MHTDLTTLLTLPDMEDRVSHFKIRFAGYLSMADAATRRLIRSHVDFLKAAMALNVTWTSASTPGAKPNLAYGALTFAAVDIKAMVDCLRATSEAGKLPVGVRLTSSASGMPPVAAFRSTSRQGVGCVKIADERPTGGCWVGGETAGDLGIGGSEPIRPGFPQSLAASSVPDAPCGCRRTLESGGGGGGGPRKPGRWRNPNDKRGNRKRH